MPLTREGSGADLAWRLAPRWIPNAALLTLPQLDALRRLLRRTPPCPARSALVAALDADPAHAAIEPHAVPESELRFLEALEDAALTRRPVRVQYHSVGHDELATRELSVARICLGHPARFLAVCHASDRLEWFRVFGVLDAQLLETVAYRPADPAHLAVLTGAPPSVSDERAGAELHVLRVPLPHAPTVLRALPFDAEVLVHEDSAELRTRVADRRPVLRFVLAWGGLVEPVSPALRTALHEAASQLLVSAASPASSPPRPTVIAKEISR